MSNLNDIFFTPAANQELTYDQVLEDVQRYFLFLIHYVNRFMLRKKQSEFLKQLGVWFHCSDSPIPKNAFFYAPPHK